MEVEDKRATEANHRDVPEYTATMDSCQLDMGSPDQDITVEEEFQAVGEEVVQKLSVGVLQHCLPDLQKCKATFVEVTENQRILIETLQQENSKFEDCQTLAEVTKTMEKAKLYQMKLLHIKRDMVSLHEKSAKLKRRALKLQQQRQKEDLQREQQREKEMERERQLIAKPANKKT